MIPPTRLVSALIIGTLSCPSWSRDISIPDLCIHDGAAPDPEVDVDDGSEGASIGPPSDEIVRKILRLVGARRNIDVVLEPDRGNACATITRDQRRMIFVDDEWLRKVTDGAYWLRFFVLAHEVGHHINSHPIGFEGRNAYQNEIDADYFAGRAMRMSGARLDVVEEYFEECPFEETPTHPPCFLRIASVREGYESLPDGPPIEEPPDDVGEGIRSASFGARARADAGGNESAGVGPGEASTESDTEPRIHGEAEVVDGEVHIRFEVEVEDPIRGHAFVNVDGNRENGLRRRNGADFVLEQDRFYVHDSTRCDGVDSDWCWHHRREVELDWESSNPDTGPYTETWRFAAHELRPCSPEAEITFDVDLPDEDRIKRSNLVALDLSRHCGVAP